MLDVELQFFKMLSDQSRLKILASLNKEPMYVELIAERLDLHPSTVSFHLKKLEEANIVTSKKEQYYTMYYIDRQKLNRNVMQIISSITTKDDNEEEREARYRRKIIRTFFEEGKLKSIPVQRKKRLIILEEIAKEFEIEKKYPEKQVNLIISEFHFDFCTIRREFIMNKMFVRENGIYERLK